MVCPNLALQSDVYATDSSPQKMIHQGELPFAWTRSVRPHSFYSKSFFHYDPTETARFSFELEQQKLPTRPVLILRMAGETSTRLIGQKAR